MFLLGRGVLGPAPLLRFGARYKKKRSAYYVPSANQAAKGKNGKAIVQRDAMGRPIVKQREKSLGTFKPLGVNSLTHALFENESPGRMELAVPPMRPRMLAPGVAMRFHDMDSTSPIRVYGVPKHMLLEFRLLGIPCSITTSTTLSLIRVLEESKNLPARLVLNGRPGVGKSFLLLQAAQYAAATRQWIVLYIPRARHFVDASTAYQYSLATRTYIQPRAAYQTLSRFARANAHLLRQLSTQSEVVLPDGGRTFPVGTPLTTLIDAGLGAATDSTAGTAPSVEALSRAPFILDAVLSELGRQEHFPVLIAIDDFQALCGRSLYRDPRFKSIRPHHLSMPRLLLEYASGRRTLARGLVLTALTRTDPQFPVPPQLSDALNLSNDSSPSPRSVRYRRSAQLAAYLEREVEEPTNPFAYLDSEIDADPELTDDELASSALADSKAGPLTTCLRTRIPSPPTAVNPFPVPKPTEEWKTMVMPRDDESADAAELGGLYDIQGEVDGEDASGADGTPDGAAAVEAEGTKKKKKKTTNPDKPSRTTKNAHSARAACDSGSRHSAVNDAPTAVRTLNSKRDTAPSKPKSTMTPSTRTTESPTSNRTTPLPPFLTLFHHPHPPPQPTSFSKTAAQSFARANRPAAPVPAPTPLDEGKQIAALQAELNSGEFDVMRALDQEMEMRSWALDRAAKDARVVSLDEPTELGMSVAKDGEYVGDEVLKEVGANAEDDFVRAAEALAGEGNVVGGEAQTYTPLELGSDPEIASLVSDGVRAALANPESIGDLMRTNVADVEQVEDSEENEDDEDEDHDVFDSTVEDADGVEPESGADELFLSKYQESSGNARTFVKGLLGTLQTSG
ncbi:hypothetical protein MSAN_00555900 [Mycena sanguinolenta]|uniref:Small ribosomal subunit protein mS29 n=1 Tax=Mycena sanguinolenta TaxID=230812 RepID=A0A8H6Z9T4_9AGAR|nr:hypothetical protein MSAN_00555900 [Mycena sanguinolenta]